MAANIKEELYIRKRRFQAFLHSVQFYLCRVFPIKKNRIAVCTFEGRGGFGCNPKYIVEELHRRDTDLEIVWLVNDMSKEFPKYIKKVPNTNWSRAYWLSTSKVWIDNYRTRYGTKKRKGQYYLNTNHYTLGIKTVGLWRGKGFSKMAYLVSKSDSDLIDELVIDSKFCEIMCPKGLIYEGSYLKTGAPRCDILYGDRTIIKRAYREKKGLSEDAKILLFAPTFREGAKDGKRFVYSEIWTIDFRRLLSNMESKFGGTWYICFRVHPQLAATFGEYKNPDIEGRILNESQADDLYEIMAAMDAYLTDYSSACFEAGFAKMPVFIYADDIKQYETDRGSLFWNMATDSLDNVRSNPDIFPGFDVQFPFLIATNNGELEKCIKAFDEEKYSECLDRFFSKNELVFTGKASAEIAERIKGMLAAY